MGTLNSKHEVQFDFGNLSTVTLNGNIPSPFCLSFEHPGHVTLLALQAELDIRNVVGVRVASLRTVTGATIGAQPNGRFYCNSEKEFPPGVYKAVLVPSRTTWQGSPLHTDIPVLSPNYCGDVERARVCLSSLLGTSRPATKSTRNTFTQGVEVMRVSSKHVIDDLNKRKLEHDIIAVAVTRSEAALRYMVAVTPETVIVAIDCSDDRVLDALLQPGKPIDLDGKVSEGDIKCEGAINAAAMAMANHLPILNLLALCNAPEDSLTATPKGHPVIIMSDDTTSFSSKGTDDSLSVSPSASSSDKPKGSLNSIHRKYTSKRFIDTPRKLVFTGFSVSGTVAHGAAILARHVVRAQLALRKSKRANKQAVTVRAITFASPSCATEEVAGYLYATNNTDNHINFFSEKDVVPRLVGVVAAESAVREQVEVVGQQAGAGLARLVKAMIKASFSQVVASDWDQNNKSPPHTYDISGLGSAHQAATGLLQTYGDKGHMTLVPLGHIMVLRESGLGSVVQSNTETHIMEHTAPLPVLPAPDSVENMSVHHAAILNTPLFSKTDIRPRGLPVTILLHMAPHIHSCSAKSVNTGLRADFEIIGSNLDLVLGRSGGQAYLYPRLQSLEFPVMGHKAESAEVATQYVTVCGNGAIQIRVLRCTPKLNAFIFVRTDFCDTPDSKIGTLNQAKTPPLGTIQYARMNSDVLMTAFLRGLLVTLHTAPARQWWQRKQPLSNNLNERQNSPQESSKEREEHCNIDKKWQLHPMLEAIADLEEILVNTHEKGLAMRRIVKENLNAEKILVAHVQIQPIIEEIVMKLSQPVELEFQHRAIRALSKVLGGLGMFFGTIFTVIGIVTLLPTLLPIIPLIAIMRTNNYQYSWGVAVFGIPTVILAIPGSVIGAVGAGIFRHAFDAWADPPSLQYIIMLKTLLRIIGGDTAGVLEEVPTLEAAICTAALTFLPPDRPLHVTREKEIKQCLDDRLQKTYSQPHDKKKTKDIGASLYMQMVERSRKDVARWLSAVGRLALIRRHLQNHILVSFVGVHNAGKSLWIQKLFGVDAPSSNILRTEEVKLFHLLSPAEPNPNPAGPGCLESNGLCIDVVDFPGTSDERRSMAMLTEELACITTLFVCIFKFGHIAGPERSVIHHLHMKGNFEYIVLINQTSRFPEFTPETESLYRENYARTLGVDPGVIIFVDGYHADRVEYVRQELFGCLQLYVDEAVHGKLATGLLHARVRKGLQMEPQLTAAWDRTEMAVVQIFAQTTAITTEAVKRQIADGVTDTRIYQPCISPVGEDDATRKPPLNSPQSEISNLAQADSDVVEILLGMGYELPYIICLLRFLPKTPSESKHLSRLVQPGSNGLICGKKQDKWLATGWVVELMPKLTEVIYHFGRLGFDSKTVLVGLEALSKRKEAALPCSLDLLDPGSSFMDELARCLTAKHSELQDKDQEDIKSSSNLLTSRCNSLQMDRYELIHRFSDTDMLTLLHRNALFKIVQPVNMSHGPYADKKINEDSGTEYRVQLFKKALSERHIGEGKRNIVITRDSSGSIVPDLLLAVRTIETERLKHGIRLEIVDDVAVDAGGVLKSAMTEVAAYLRQGKHPLFSPKPSGEVYFSAQGYLDKENTGLSYNAMGRVVGICLQNIGSACLPNCFPMAVFKAILGHPIGLTDLEAFDPDLARGIRTMCLLDQETFDGLFQTFSASVGISVETQSESDDNDISTTIASFDLMPLGSTVDVTSANRLNFLLRYTWFHLGRCLPLQEFILGVSQACPRDLLSVFTPAMLQIAVNGCLDVDFGLIQRQSTVLNNSTESFPQAKWFWEVAMEMTKKDQALLLAFVTGSSVPPIGGLQICIKKSAKCGVTSLPLSHTCVNMLDIPSYPTKEVLEERLLYAIRNTGITQFGMT